MGKRVRRMAHFVSVYDTKRFNAKTLHQIVASAASCLDHDALPQAKSRRVCIDSNAEVVGGQPRYLSELTRERPEVGQASRC